MATQSYLIDQITDREIDVLRVANRTASEASKQLIPTYKRIMRMLRENPKSRWYRLALDIESLLLDKMDDSIDVIKSDLKDIAPIQARWTEALLVTATTIETVKRLPAQTLATYLNEPMSHFIQGKKVTQPTVDKILSTLGKRNARTVRNMVRDGAMEGRTAQQLARDIRHISITSNRTEIESNVLTCFNHFSNKAKQAVYAENSDILNGVRLIATLDSGTTLTCMGYDMTTWPLNSGPRPPFHYRCRTQVVPEVMDKYRIPIKGGMRASEFGPVGANTTYNGFLLRQSKARQNEILGPHRAKLFRGGMDVKKFTNDRGVYLTLKQLEKRYPGAFK